MQYRLGRENRAAAFGLRSDYFVAPMGLLGVARCIRSMHGLDANRVLGVSTPPRAHPPPPAVPYGPSKAALFGVWPFGSSNK